MAITPFEFIQCDTINIQYAVNGLATVSFTVVSTSNILSSISGRDYTQLTFGGIDFKAFITQVELAPIPASIPTVWEHRITLVATGCSPICPVGGTRPA